LVVLVPVEAKDRDEDPVELGGLLMVGNKYGMESSITLYNYSSPLCLVLPPGVIGAVLLTLVG